MNKYRPKIILYIAVLIIIVAAASAVLYVHYSDKCQDIIGDGYYIGTDPEPVVIGNTCDE